MEGPELPRSSNALLLLVYWRRSVRGDRCIRIFLDRAKAHLADPAKTNLSLVVRDEHLLACAMTKCLNQPLLDQVCFHAIERKFHPTTYRPNADALAQPTFPNSRSS